MDQELTVVTKQAEPPTERSGASGPGSGETASAYGSGRTLPARPCRTRSPSAPAPSPLHALPLYAGQMRICARRYVIRSNYRPPITAGYSTTRAQRTAGAQRRAVSGCNTRSAGARE